jgi:hypothetical protein
MYNWLCKEELSSDTPKWIFIGGVEWPPPHVSHNKNMSLGIGLRELVCITANSNHEILIGISSVNIKQWRGISDYLCKICSIALNWLSYGIFLLNLSLTLNPKRVGGHILPQLARLRYSWQKFVLERTQIVIVNSSLSVVVVLRPFLGRSDIRLSFRCPRLE